MAAAAAAPDRGTPDLEHMRRAIALARKAGLEDKTGRPFGSVIVEDATGRVVGEGTNQVVARNDPTHHAEMEAIREACAALGSTSLAGCTLYASSQPCPMCTGVEDLVKHGVYKTAKDTFYGREDCLDPPERTHVPFTQVLREEAAAVHAEYGAADPSQLATY